MGFYHWKWLKQNHTLVEHVFWTELLFLGGGFKYVFFMFTPILGILPLKMVETESYFSGTCFLNRTFVSRWWFKYVFLMFTPILGILPLKMVETESYLSGTCFLNRTFVSRWWFQMCFFNVHPDPWGNDPIWRAFFGGIGWNQPPVRNALIDGYQSPSSSMFPSKRPWNKPLFLVGGVYLWCKVGPKKTLEQWKKPWLI